MSHWVKHSYACGCEQSVQEAVYSSCYLGDFYLLPLTLQPRKPLSIEKEKEKKTQPHKTRMTSARNDIRGSTPAMHRCQPCACPPLFHSIPLLATARLQSAVSDGWKSSLVLNPPNDGPRVYAAGSISTLAQCLEKMTT